MKLLDNYLNKRIKALGYEPKVTRFHSSFIHPDYDELMGYASAGYRPDGSRVSPQSSIDDLTAGFGFAGAPLPNTEPVVAPAAATGSVSETNLYTPATTTNAEWALMPQGSIRAPQAWYVFITGIFSTSVAGQTFTWTTRVGTSATPSSNVSLGASGALNPNAGSTIATGLFFYTGIMTIRTPGTSGTIYNNATITQNTTTTPATAVVSAVYGNTAGTVDTSLQQGYVLSVTLSNSAATAQLTSFSMIAID